MIEFKDVAKYYKTKTGVTEGIRNINVKFSLNEFVAITGESGSGKTTLLNVLSGFDSYEDGEILINGNETSHFTVKDWEMFRAANVGFVFQNYNIIESYTVYQNIIIALDAQGYDKSKRKERALELIKEVGLETHVHHKTAKLSGGQKQRVVIARALAKDAPIILADEPTGNLDKASGEEIMKLLKKISENKLVLLVTHNFLEAKPYVTRNVVMEDGNIKDDQTYEQLSTNEENINIVEELPKNTILNSFKLALKNIFSTPKRTIFSLSLSLLAIIVFLFFYSTLILSSRSELNFQIGNEIYLINRDGSKFTKEEFNILKEKHESKYIKVFVSFPNIDGYYEHEIRQVKIPLINVETMDGKIILENTNEIVIPSDYYVFSDFEVGDSIKLTINDIEKTFVIKGFSEKVAFYVHPDLLFDKENFVLNNEFFTETDIKELLIIGVDRSEILLFKKELPNDIRIIDSYLRYEGMEMLGTGIITIVFWVLLIGIMSVLFLVTYNILKNMMQARNKDFAVYRSIGVSESEVGVMILMEQLFISISSFVIVFVSLKVLSLISFDIYKVNRMLKLSDYILISIIFLLFSFAQGLKFNRKLFNLTVIDSLKEDH